MTLRSPQTPKEFEAYYELRWQILRQPWNQPKGSERDELEDESYHIAAFDGDKIVGVGRLHALDQQTGQIRYMAVSPDYAGQGLGQKIMQALESYAKTQNFTAIELNSREVAIPFYHKQGYQSVRPTHIIYGKIPHTLMHKDL